MKPNRRRTVSHKSFKVKSVSPVWSISCSATRPWLSRKKALGKGLDCANERDNPDEKGYLQTVAIQNEKLCLHYVHINNKNTQIKQQKV